MTKIRASIQQQLTSSVTGKVKVRCLQIANTKWIKETQEWTLTEKKTITKGENINKSMHRHLLDIKIAFS